jgi:protein TonB
MLLNYVLRLHNILGKAMSVGTPTEAISAVKHGSGRRLLSVAFPAVVVTGGLFLIMAGMIREEFQPEDTVEIAEFEINPQVDEVTWEERDIKMAERVEIETPPAPPIIERAKSDKPTEPIVEEAGRVPDFPKPTLPKRQFDPAIIDRDPQPLVRIPPQMPPRAERSGHCQMQFNVSPEGAPYDVVATSCSQSIFARPSVKAVQRWKYAPKIQDGIPVGRTGLETRISFNLTDERGRLIPE